MERLRRVALSLILLTVWSTVLCGCAKKLPVDYRDRPFAALVEWQAGEKTVKAKITADASGGVEMVLMAPEGLCGVILRAEGERRTVRCGEIKLDGDGAEALFSVMTLLLPTGERNAVCETEWRGEKVLYVEIRGEEPTELYLSRESGVPIAIRRGSVTLEISEFQLV